MSEKNASEALPFVEIFNLPFSNVQLKRSVESDELPTKPEPFAKKETVGQMLNCVIIPFPKEEHIVQLPKISILSVNEIFLKSTDNSLSFDEVS